MHQLNTILTWISITILSLIKSSLSQSLSQNYFEVERNSLPCSPYDTINITNGILNADNTITHHGITYERKHYKLYNYVYDDHETKIEVENHFRGCICYYKPCIRQCCPLNKQYDVTNATCIPSGILLSLNITIERYGVKYVKNLVHDEDYAIFYNKPCHGKLYTTLASEKEWKLEEVS